MNKNTLVKRGVALLGLCFFLIALLLIRRQVERLNLHEVVLSLEAMPWWRILASLICVVCAYLALTGYDLLGMRYIKAKLPARQVITVSFLSFAFSMNLGAQAISGGSVRYRYYSALGLGGANIARLIVFCVFSTWTGYAFLAGISLTIPPATAGSLPLLEGPLHHLGLLGIAVPFIFIGLCHWWKKPVRFGQWELGLPTPGLATALAILSTIEWSLAGSVLYFLLPADAGLGWFQTIEYFLISQIAGVATQVPGGVGVFEATFLMLAPDNASNEGLLGALLLFRVMYYFLPLLVGTIIIAIEETIRHREAMKRTFQGAAGWSQVAVPSVLAGAVFLSGFILLATGAVPAVPGRMHWLGGILPLAFIEISHFLASMVGVLLLGLAWGLAKKVDAAYYMVMGLLATGALLALLRGGDIGAATVLAVIAVSLMPCRSHFTRRSRLMAARFSPGWWVAIFAAAAGTFWLGLFSYKHVEYNSELWWYFSLHGDASRFLRASVGMGITILSLGIFQLMRPSLRSRESIPGEIPPEVLPLVRSCPNSMAWLAMLGDKQFFFSAQRNAFVMYGDQGSSRIVMGDPVGPEEEWDDLLWDFREFCERDGATPVFYQVSATSLHHYAEMGLTILKLGEEGRVKLTGFNLEGKSRARLRQAISRCERDGYRFEVIPAEQVAGLIPELRAISNEWLQEKSAAEKGFSLGNFREDFMELTPAAIVLRGDRIVAFANIWLGGNSEEIAPDMMRYGKEAPDMVMDYLFARMMLWGAAEGYCWFTLGMAPLTGLENRPLAPLWNRVGTFIFEHGEHFYNFEGLRNYKEKYGPTWSARFLVTAGGLTLPRTLLDVATLISGGVRKLVAK